RSRTARRLLDSVQTRAVVPENLAPRRVAQAVERQEGVDRARVGRVVVRPVGRDDEVVVTHRRDRVTDDVLVRVDRYPAVAQEVLARGHRQAASLFVTELFDALVEAPEPPWHPAAAALEKRRLERGEALEYAAGQETAEGHHLLDPVGHRVRHHEVVHEAPAE